MPSPEAHRESKSRSPVWTRVLALVFLIAGGVGAYSFTTLGEMAADKSALVEVSSLKAGSERAVSLKRTSFTEASTTPYTSVRLVNGSTEQVRVALHLGGVEGSYPGTLTSTLTLDGTDQVSGDINDLKLSSIPVAPHSTVVVRLTFDGDTSSYAQLWAQNSEIKVTVNVE